MTHDRNSSLEMKFCRHLFFIATTTKKLRIVTMADDNNTVNFITNIKGPSIAS